MPFEFSYEALTLSHSITDCFGVTMVSYLLPFGSKFTSLLTQGWHSVKSSLAETLEFFYHLSVSGGEQKYHWTFTSNNPLKKFPVTELVQRFRLKMLCNSFQAIFYGYFQMIPRLMRCFVLRVFEKVRLERQY